MIDVKLATTPNALGTTRTSDNEPTVLSPGRAAHMGQTASRIVERAVMSP